MTKQTRWAVIAAAVVGAGMLAGCPPVSKPSETQPVSPTTQAAFANLPEAPILGTEPAVRGVYVVINRSVPLTEKALARARMTEDEVRSALQAAMVAQGAQTAAATAPATMSAAPPAADDRAGEAPPLAVKYYLQGRQKFLEGANSEAVTALEQALALDPNAFTVLRLMGRVCFASSQLARGAMYLERAQALRPDDIEANYLLGRYWIERNDFDKAAYFLLRASDSPERQITSTYTPLSAFYLGTALQLGGYHRAAAHEYEHFLELAELPVPGYRYDGELSYLINMPWAAHLAAAENDARIGDYHASLPHYRAAAAARPDDTFIASRLINALVRDGQPAPAQKAALTLVTATSGGEDAVRLLAWTYQAAGRQADLIPDLQALLKASAPLGSASEQKAAIVLSAAQEYQGRKLEALRTLADFLDAHPADRDVLGRLLRRADSAPAFTLAMNAAANAIAAQRDDSRPVVQLFAPVAQGPVGAMYIHAAVARQNAAAGSVPLPPAARSASAFALDYLEALTRQAQNLPLEQVEPAFEAALQADGNFFPAAEEYVSYLLDQEKFSKATSVIDSILQSHPAGAQTCRLQILSEIAQQRYLHALQLAQEARASFPEDVDLRLQLAAVYRLRGQDSRADAELQALIRDFPKNETAYRVLINSLFDRMSGSAANPNAVRDTVVATLNQMAGALPDSRFLRIAFAVINGRGGRFDVAENLLRSAVAQDPTDPVALVSLAKVQDVVGHTSDAVALLENALRRKAQPEVVGALASLYRAQDRKAEALALAKRYADETPDSVPLALQYVAELQAQDKPADAIAQLVQLRARFPRSQDVAAQLARSQQEAGDNQAAAATMRDFIRANGETSNRLYALAHYDTLAGNDDASVAALQRLLAIMPDHIGANNDLGYFWVNAGIHLEQAEPMINKALDNKPDDPAFLDSLAWLHYKQGRFEQAATLLQKVLASPEGAAPEVIQHFADTLYRLGRTPEAVTQWEKALQLLTISGRLAPPDLKERDYLIRVVSEARAGRAPDVSPTVAGPAVITDPTKAAGPVAIPETMPQN
jgi:tetratricopeptide (TPR) repeat protein